MDRSNKACIAFSKALNNSSDRNDIRSCITIFERKSAKEYLKYNQRKNIRKRIREKNSAIELLLVKPWVTVPSERIYGPA